MRLAPRVPDELPTRPGLRDGLIGTGFVLAPHGEPGRFCPPIRLFDQPLFASVSGSVTRTTPLLRLRSAVPVGHQVRVC